MSSTLGSPRQGPPVKYFDDPLADKLLTLITTGELSPGQRVDQREVSELLEVSRTPLREALKALQADGILTHEPNRGYTVTKLGASDLLQYLSLRFFIEAELINSMEWPTPEQLAELKAANDWYSNAGERGDIGEMAQANRKFHFLIFSWSPSAILFREMRRIWRITDAYQMSLVTTAERRREVIKDHRAIVAAIESRDRKRLAKFTDAHRARARGLLVDYLGGPLPARLARPDIHV
jgi:DNA-binding GntR family transcriptional regulator